MLGRRVDILDLLLVYCLTFPANDRFLLEDNDLLAFLLEIGCNSQPSWTSSDDTNRWDSTLDRGSMNCNIDECQSAHDGGEELHLVVPSRSDLRVRCSEVGCTV